MKRTIFICILFTLLLSACSSSQPAPTATSLPTNKPIPTSTETPTPSIPMIDVGGVKVPDPKVSNPELFDVSKPDSPIVQYANAFGVKAEEVGELKPIAKTSIDGKQFIILTTSDLTFTTNFDETGTPLLIAEQQEDGEWKWSKATLRKLGNKVGMPIGSLLEMAEVENLDIPKQLDIAKEEFSSTVIGVDWFFREKEPGVLNFNYPDKMLEFAQTQNMIPIAQHLVWSEALPEWLKTGTYSNEQIISMMEEHIIDMMDHYPAVKIWSVVNESWIYDSRNPIELDLLHYRLGDDYIEMAFSTARRKDPTAILLYSDLANEVVGEKNKMNHEIVQALKEKGLIDGLAMHMRIDAAHPPKEDELINMMQSYDIPIYITELTVDLTNVKGAQEERFLKQAEIYRTVMDAALKSGVVNVFNMWGIGDSSNWLEIDVGKPNADPTIFDNNLNRKPAYYALLSALANGENK